MKLKKFSHKFHIYVSVFLLPMALLFAITGILYIFGISKDALGTSQQWVIEEVVPKEKQFDFLIDFLIKNHIKLPSEIEPRDFRGAMLVGSAKYFFTLETKDNKTIITSIKRSLLGNLFVLHFAKAKWYFDVLSVVFGIALVLFYISGVIMTAFCKSNRREIFITFLAGLVVSILLGYLSL